MILKWFHLSLSLLVSLFFFFPPHSTCVVFLLYGLYILEFPGVFLDHILLTPWYKVLLEKLTWFAANQEIPRISRNPKAHYRTHKRPPPVSILGQPNPVHIPTSHLLEIHPNIIHPSKPRSPQWSLSLRFPHQDPIQPLLLTHTRHMPSPSHSFRFYHPHRVG